LFDDLKLTPIDGISEIPVPVSLFRSGNNLNLAFATYLDRPYVVRWKTDLTLPDWLDFTNLSGDGTVQSVTVDTHADAGFYRVMRLCD
jgi:hypothetical protein